MKFIFNVDDLIIELEDIREPTLKKGDLELEFVNDYNLEKNARIYGTVMAIPRKLSGVVSTFERKSGNEMAPIHMNQHHMEVIVGDRVYFHYLANHEKAFVSDGTDRLLLRVRYDMLIARVRGGVIHPLCTNVLVAPEFDDWDDITNKEGIITMSSPGRRNRTGVVKYAGNNYKGREMELEPGHRVLFMKKADRIIEVEDEEVYPIKYNHIHCILPENLRYQDA